MIGDIEAAKESLARAEQIGHEPLDGEPRVLKLQDVNFEYPGAERPSVADVDLSVPMGTTLGLVGPSGAGKSTLIDILLGLLIPTSGTIQVDDQPLEDVLGAWRSRVGCVRRHVALFNSTIAHNNALTSG